MPNLTVITVKDGVPIVGDGTVSTIDALLASLLAGTTVLAALPAGEAMLGQTSFYPIDVVDAPATTAGPYSAGDVIGGRGTVTLARANDKGILITGVQIAIKSNVTPNIRVVLHGAAPAAAALADNDAYTLTAADVMTVRKTLSSSVDGRGWNTHGTSHSISLAAPPFIMAPISGARTIIYHLIDDTGVTLGTTSDVQIRFSGVGA